MGIQEEKGGSWEEEKDIEKMLESRISVEILDVSSPGFHLPPVHLLFPAQFILTAMSTQTHFLPHVVSDLIRPPATAPGFLSPLQDDVRSAAVCFPARVNYITQLYHCRADAEKLN